MFNTCSFNKLMTDITKEWLRGKGTPFTKMDVKTITNEEVTGMETNCKRRCRKDQKFSSDAYHVGKK